jgi:hypothetical protein
MIINIKALRDIVRYELNENNLHKYFMTETETRADLKKLPPKRDQYTALGRDVNAVIARLQDVDKKAKRIKSGALIQRRHPDDVINELYDEAFSELNLSYLGAGVSRTVYAINKDLVLKFQRNQAPEWEQNKQEIKLINSGLLGEFVPRIYASGSFNSRWLICDRVVPISNQEDALEWLRKVDLLNLYFKLRKLTAPNEYEDRKQRKENDIDFRDFRYIITNVLSDLDIDSIKESINMSIEESQNVLDMIMSNGREDQLTTSNILNYRKQLDFHNRKLEELLTSKKEIIEMFKDNKFLQAILRSHAELKFSLSDIHHENVAFAGTDRRPVMSDVGFNNN